MARGVKRTVDELLSEIDSKIERKQRSINQLKAQRKEIELGHQVELAAKVVKLAEEKGISIDEILGIVSEKQ